MTHCQKLDPREAHFRIPSPRAGLHLFLRHLPPPDGIKPRGIVLYVHGGTFSSALSIAHRFDGRSWRDELCDAGFHVWGLDFHGFGHLSSPYPDPDPHTPLGRTAEASRQLEQAVRFILAHHAVPRLSLVAHSWGTMVSGHLAGRCPELIDRMVFFGPIAQRPASAAAPKLPAWRLITLQDQWDRFTADVPPDEPPVLSKRHFEEWGEAYLDSDPESRDRQPARGENPRRRLPGHLRRLGRHPVLRSRPDPGRRSRSSAANGTACAPTPTPPGCWPRSPPPATPKSPAPPT